MRHKRTHYFFPKMLNVSPQLSVCSLQSAASSLQSSDYFLFPTVFFLMSRLFNEDCLLKTGDSLLFPASCSDFHHEQGSV